MSFHATDSMINERHRELMEEADRDRLAAQAAASTNPRSSVTSLLRRAAAAVRAAVAGPARVPDWQFEIGSVPRVHDYPIARRR